jgi:3-hydroxy-9,10-secoandrosta-1,3,5(10)-triene-9,17-dione monooxygenase reductase component
MSADDQDSPIHRGSLHGVFSIGHAARAKADRSIDGVEVRDEDGIAPDAFWATLRRLAGGVTVVSAVGEEGYLGITVSACCLVSLAPPLFLAALHNESQVLDAIMAGSGFAVSFVSGRQVLLAEIFAGRAPAPDAHWTTINHRTAVTGAPILLDGLAWLDCRLWQAVPAGDHTLLIGTVVAAGVNAGQDDPLLYFGSQYRRLAP